jgi:hypothetical protein
MTNNNYYDRVGKVLTEGLSGEEIEHLQLIEKDGVTKLIIDLKYSGRYVITPGYVGSDDPVDLFFDYGYEPKESNSDE